MAPSHSGPQAPSSHESHGLAHAGPLASAHPADHLQHLPHLHLAQVFDALSYYSDHQAEINRYIELNHVPAHLVHPAARR